MGELVREGEARAREAALRRANLVLLALDRVGERQKAHIIIQ